jgi:probable F420-dependent oxidoreductase
MVHRPYAPELVTGEGVLAFARAAEAAGFDGVGFTDHPAPSDRWLNAGGHDALDPFAALAFVAAATERVRLIPNILVLPYRNPFIVAKAIATIDMLSGGRFTANVATGYLKSEYRALGVDFDERNDLFDEALDVLRGVWTTDDFRYEGRHFSASGQSANPKPTAPIPVWIGGNSKLSRRRVARKADGWCPFPTTPEMAATTKTPPLETVDDLQRMLDELWGWVEEAGRDPGTIDVAFGASAGGDPGDESFDGSARLEALDGLAARGVTWTGVGVPHDSLAHAIEGLERYGSTVIHPATGDG